MTDRSLESFRYEDWDSYFMAQARLVAKKSKDQSVQVGVVIVGPDHELRSSGYNGFCRGIDENIPERWERPIKYSWVEHAERNAIYNAARIGVSTKGCTAYMESPPCSDCGRALIQAGIIEVVVTTQNPFRDRKDWKESIQFAMDMLAEAGVHVRWTDL
jgi:dCMP deaminase